ncbi:hypothetical protein ZWY2020_014466 [Hordeum vulgare]|nr:hypothetical protein ZWY2020_014466 [Hordeum vulgare]
MACLPTHPRPPPAASASADPLGRSGAVLYPTYARLPATTAPGGGVYSLGMLLPELLTSKSLTHASLQEATTACRHGDICGAAVAERKGRRGRRWEAVGRGVVWCDLAAAARRPSARVALGARRCRWQLGSSN